MQYQWTDFTLRQFSKDSKSAFILGLIVRISYLELVMALITSPNHCTYLNTLTPVHQSRVFGLKLSKK